jgi:two-component system nitrogen regulation response regulator NtrX
MTKDPPLRSTDILIVDDEIGIRELLSEILQDEGYTVALAENADVAKKLRNLARPVLVLLDIWMPDTDGVTLLKEWARNGQLTMPVVMMSGHATIDTAVEATRIGAFDFLEKPIALQKLLATVKRALTQGEAQPKRPLALASLGKSQAINELKDQLDQIATLKTPLLLAGEPGVGFDACARYLHQPTTPYVAVAGNDQLADGPLELLNKAANGMLFVPEIGFLDRRAQQGLTLVLGKLDKHNVRLVAATTRQLNWFVSSPDFDPNLFALLSGLVIAVPPLREHAEDIVDLASQLLDQLVETQKVPPRRFSSAALNALRQHDWPGNLEQLNNVVKSVALTASTHDIDMQHVTRTLAQFGSSPKKTTPFNGFDLNQPLRELRDQFERLYFEHHIALEKGNMSRVAEKAGLERTHLYRKLKQLGVRIPRKGEE